MKIFQVLNYLSVSVFSLLTRPYSRTAFSLFLSVFVLSHFCLKFPCTGLEGACGVPTVDESAAYLQRIFCRLDDMFP